MTYAEHINILSASYRLKSKLVKKRFQLGFTDTNDIISYFQEEKDSEEARVEYFEYFTKCVRMNLDLDQEI